jgi:hypothetical protein
MAIIKDLYLCNDKPQVRSAVSADYCFDQSLFQIRTYKDGDKNRSEGSKQNIQINKDMAQVIIKRLQEFLNQ